MNFFAELKRRNVYKVAIAYGVIAWLLIQIATQTNLSGTGAAFTSCFGRCTRFSSRAHQGRVLR
jgi:hypothetical protein